jgi:putative ABC transport system ATP-binding protein
MQSSITASDIHKTFTTGSVPIHVLKGLSIDIYPGEMTLIIGPSGCGKSTLLALLSGLNRPDIGRITVLGENFSALSDDAMDEFRLHHAGFIFQGFNLFPALTALEQVILPLQYLDVGEAEAEARARESLTHVGLKTRMHLRPSELSGGEKQRVAIARVLAKKPKLLFADEPTSALDKVSGQNVVDILHRTARDYGTTVLCVSHDQRLIAHADRVLAMEDGMIQSDERPDPAKKQILKEMLHEH